MALGGCPRCRSCGMAAAGPWWRPRPRPRPCRPAFSLRGEVEVSGGALHGHCVAPQSAGRRSREGWWWLVGVQGVEGGGARPAAEVERDSPPPPSATFPWLRSQPPPLARPAGPRDRGNPPHPGEVTPGPRRPCGGPRAACPTRPPAGGRARWGGGRLEGGRGIPMRRVLKKGPPPGRAGGRGPGGGRRRWGPATGRCRRSAAALPSCAGRGPRRLTSTGGWAPLLLLFLFHRQTESHLSLAVRRTDNAGRKGGRRGGGGLRPRSSSLGGRWRRRPPARPDPPPPFRGGI